jgi:carbonic anhydrase/acetyltransferase-like protein (isoleucine patch superfamily)
MLREVDGLAPTVAESAYVDETAVVVGDVVLEDESSVWPNATLRGDSGQIVVGQGSNVQDNAVLHEQATLASHVTVGHSAIVHNATVADGALVGMNATVLDGAHVGTDAIVGAGAVVTEGTEVPPATLYTGVPATHTADLDDHDTRAPAHHYVQLGTRYRETNVRLD